MKISRPARIADLVCDLFTRVVDVAYALIRLKGGHSLIDELPDRHGSVSLRAYAYEAVLGLKSRGILDNFLDVLATLRPERSVEIGLLKKLRPYSNVNDLSDGASQVHGAVLRIAG